MKDYSLCSDFEINKAVDDILFPPKHGVVKGYNRRYCTEPNHAWPIIVGYDIALFKTWCSDSTISNTTWTATTDLDKSWVGYTEDGYDFSDTNPLRAAMIVYLMMMDAKT